MRRIAATIVLCAALSCSAGAEALFIGMPDSAPETGTPASFKYLHFLAGLALGLSSAELVHALPLAPALPADSLLFPAAALGASVIGGIAKELLDSTGFGDPAVADALVTMLGGIAAAAVVCYGQSLYPSSPAGRSNEASFLLSSAAVMAIPVVIGFIGEIERFIRRRHQARYG